MEGTLKTTISFRLPAALWGVYVFIFVGPQEELEPSWGGSVFQLLAFVTASVSAPLSPQPARKWDLACNRVRAAVLL